MVDCNDCQHFRKLPGGTVWKRRTGCYHPELKEQKQSEAVLAAQEIPGDHLKLNANGDCAYFSALRNESLISRMFAALRT